MLEYYELLLLKEKYPDHQLIYLNLYGSEFVFRTLTRKEYQTLLRVALEEDEFQDHVCQTALIYPEDFEFEYSPFAGLAPEASFHIVKQSGFTNMDQIFEFYDQAKIKNQGFEIECMSVIKAAMGEYTYEEMEDWTWQRLMDYVSRAERILELRGIDAVHLERNNEEAQEEAPLTIDNKEFVEKLVEKGIDPMFYFKEEVKPRKAELIDFPLIGGSHWQSEEVLNAIREQMAKQTN